MMRWIGGGLLIVLVVIAATAFFPRDPSVSEVELTRLVWNERLQPELSSQSFTATADDARLSATPTCDGENLAITLNGVEIKPGAEPLNVALLAENSIALAQPSTLDACASLRITQVAEITMHVLSRVHFNTNVSDFSKAREFYGALGFETLSGFPDTNTQAMARAIGIDTPTDYDGAQGASAGGYLLHGELVGPEGFAGGVIDLIEFQIPKDNEPPYARLNHLGMVKAVMHTSDLDADLAALKANNIAVLAPATQRADGSRFAIFRDQDGTSYELREEGEAATETDGFHIHKLGAVSINVSDYERSVAWYRMLGFELTSTLTSAPTQQVSKALGFEEPIEVQGALVTHQQDRSTLELVQWLTPWDPEPPYPLPVNHLGIHRMAFSTSDIEADVATLKRHGVELVSPITPCCSGDDSWGAIVAFMDPDGTVLELVEQPMMTPLLNFGMRVGALLE